MAYHLGMWRTVPDSIDRFPGDFMASLRVGTIAAGLLGTGSWWLAREYMLRTHPGHTELMGAAIVVGVMDGLMLGIAAFVATYVLRVWRYERRLRKASDAALQLALNELDRGRDEDPRRPS